VLESLHDKATKQLPDPPPVNCSSPTAPLCILHDVLTVADARQIKATHFPMRKVMPAMDLAMVVMAVVGVDGGKDGG
jgi:hypothetical protein